MTLKQLLTNSKIDDSPSLENWFDENQEFKEIADDFISVAKNGENSYTLMETLSPEVQKIILQKFLEEGLKVEKKQEPFTCYNISW